MRYTDSPLTLPEIAAELNVETLMEGTVRYAGDRVRITAQLIDPDTGTHLWSDTYERVLDDVFSIESDIATNIANALEAEFSPDEQARIEQIPTRSSAAYQLYLKARGALFSFDKADSSISDLDQAIRLDSQFALAHALKALYLVSPGDAVTGVDLSEEQASMARESAEQALELDPNAVLAHLALGRLLARAGSLAEARAAYERALQLSPNDPLVLFPYAQFKRYLGEYGDAIRLSQRLVELDPNEAVNYVQLGFSHWYSRNFDAAITPFRRASELSPAEGTPHAWIAFVEISRGNNDDALRELRLAEQLWSEGAAPLRLAQVAFAYGQMGRSDDAARIFATLRERFGQEHVTGAVWAIAYFAIGDFDEAYRRLELAVNSPPGVSQIALAEIKANPYGDQRLEEARWRSLRDRIGTL